MPRCPGRFRNPATDADLWRSSSVGKRVLELTKFCTTVRRESRTANSSNARFNSWRRCLTWLPGNDFAIGFFSGEGHEFYSACIDADRFQTQVHKVPPDTTVRLNRQKASRRLNHP